jgi:uncharacterized protein (TIGR02266 family)
MIEKRKHLRLQFGFRVHAKSGKEAWVAEDISVGGCFLKAIESMPVGSKIDLVFQLPGSSRYIEAAGEVKHVRERGMGLEFIDMDNKEKDEVDRFVQDVYQFIGKHE